MTIIFNGFGHVMVEVAAALIPLFLFYLFFQIFFLKLPKHKVFDIMKGLVLAFFGLSLFLQGVHIGFLPAGEVMGEILGQLSYNWVVIPIGFILGFVATFAEPAVRVMNMEVEKASGGYISEKVMLVTLSLGVAIAVALSMLRILIGFPVLYILIPGYLTVFIIMFFTSRSFTAIAFDSGGVATGPMAVTFILALSVGIAAGMEGRDPVSEGFGMIAVVALAPILSVLILGLLFGRKGGTELARSVDHES